jgi:hypothetical protein
MKLSFVSVNGHRETYFVDKPHICCWFGGACCLNPQGSQTVKKWYSYRVRNDWGRIPELATKVRRMVIDSYVLERTILLEYEQKT